MSRLTGAVASSAPPVTWCLGARSELLVHWASLLAREPAALGATAPTGSATRWAATTGALRIELTSALPVLPRGAPFARGTPTKELRGCSFRARRTLRSPASVPRQRRGGLALARSARAVKCDGYLKHRARQVQLLVMQPAVHLSKRRTDAEPRAAISEASGTSPRATGHLWPGAVDVGLALPHRRQAAERCLPAAHGGNAGAAQGLVRSNRGSSSGRASLGGESAARDAT